jgi:hypothetical protein
MALYINSSYMKIKSKSKTGCEQLLAVIGGYFYSILASSAPLVIVSLMSLFIPVSSNVAVSACSTLQANTYSGRRDAGPLLLSSLHVISITHLPYKLGLTAVVVLICPSWLSSLFHSPFTLEWQLACVAICFYP